jgi:hypothetical protein
MNEIPETKYARSGDLHIAYQVLGEGPFDVVTSPGWISHMEHQWGSRSLRTSSGGRPRTRACSCSTNGEPGSPTARRAAHARGVHGRHPSGHGRRRLRARCPHRPLRLGCAQRDVRRDDTVRRQLDRYRGVEVGTAGDGFLATFDGPARAIQCALAVRANLAPLGLDVRAGLHTGEIERSGSDVRGIAVHIGARVAALAGPGEVLASNTVKDLVVGSGIGFEARGSHTLKGVPDEWLLFAVRN